MSQDKTNKQNLNAVPEVESLDEKAEEITSGGMSAENFLAQEQQIAQQETIIAAKIGIQQSDLTAAQSETFGI